MRPQQHLIKRQILELTVADPRDAHRLQQEVSRIYRRRLVPILDRYCSELSAPDRIDRIDSLEVNLGTLDLDNLEDDLVDRFTRELPRALSHRIEQDQRPAGDRAIAPRSRSQLELLAVFARNGRLPWWADPSRPRLLDDAVADLAQQAPDQLRPLLRELAREPGPLRRIVLHAEDATLAAVFRLLAPALDRALPDLPARLLRALTESPALAGRGRAATRTVLWQTLLLTAGQDARRNPEPMVFCREVLLQVAARLGVPWASVWSGLRETMGGSSPGGASPGDPLAALLNRSPLIAGPQPAQGSARNESEPLPGAVADQTAPNCPPAVAGFLADLDQTRQLADEPAQDRPPVVPDRRPAAPPARRAAGRQPGVEGQPTERLPGPDRAEEDSGDRNPAAAAPDLRFSQTDEIHVVNAGLVLLWPFLGRFFEHLGLVEGKAFRDAAAVHRAVGLLGYLATEDPAPAEYPLPLCKVLCGMELAEVFEFGSPVTDAEAEACAILLGAVIGHATILRNMSIAGFRGTFLIRQGVLDTRDGAWLLRVERQTYDIVLERFPWTVEWVKLAWMEAPMRVEW